MNKNLFALIETQKHETAKGVIEALEYHCDNFRIHEKRKDHRKLSFEAQAYINQLGKFSHYLFYIENDETLSLVEPVEAELKEVWDSFHKGGCLYTLRNKWSAHRSVDYPMDDSIGTHSFVVSNLDDLRVSMWTKDDEFELNFAVEKDRKMKPCCFVLSQMHPKIIVFLRWFFEEVESLLSARDTVES